MVSSMMLLNRNAKSTDVLSAERPIGCGRGTGPGRRRSSVVLRDLLDGRRVRRVELTVLDQVGVDGRGLDVTLVVERDRTAHAVTGVLADEVVDVLGAGLAGGQGCQEDVRRVVGL